MGRKGGEKKGAGRGSKGQGKPAQTAKAAADGPTIKVKSGALDISQRNAARIRDILLQVRTSACWASHSQLQSTAPQADVSEQRATHHSTNQRDDWTLWSAHCVQYRASTSHKRLSPLCRGVVVRASVS